MTILKKRNSQEVEQERDKKLEPTNILQKPKYDYILSTLTIRCWRNRGLPKKKILNWILKIKNKKRSMLGCTTYWGLYP